MVPAARSPPECTNSRVRPTERYRQRGVCQYGNATVFVYAHVSVRGYVSVQVRTAATLQIAVQRQASCAHVDR